MTLLSPEEIAPVKADLDQTLAALDGMLLGRPELHRLVLSGILAHGHILLEGLPGLGKTALVKALSEILELDSKRVQFTPDLMPSDILGAHILETKDDGRREMVFKPGPVFCNLLLADEINRASPKTQSAMLETMQERSVTLMGVTRPLPNPFFVLASQNPIELEGTYPLPEAQTDRFLFKLHVAAPSAETLSAIISTRSHGTPPKPSFKLPRAALTRAFETVAKVVLPEAVANWIGRLVAATHSAEHVTYGASPRAAIALAESARAMALMDGRPSVGFDDVRAVAEPVLNHRLILGYRAKLDKVTPKTIIDKLLATVRVAALVLIAGFTLSADAHHKSSSNISEVMEPWRQSAQTVDGGIENLEFMREYLGPKNSPNRGALIANITLFNSENKERTFSLVNTFSLSAPQRRPSVVVPPNGSTTVTFTSCPCGYFADGSWRSGATHGSLSITETTPGSKKATYTDFHGLGYTSGTGINVLIEKPTLSAEMFAEAFTTNAGRSCSLNVQTLKRQAKDWPRDPRVYAMYDAVVLSPDTYAALSPAAQAALGVYERLGGTLGLLTNKDLANHEQIGRLRNRSFSSFAVFANDGRTIGVHSYISTSEKLRRCLEKTPLELENSLPIGVVLATLALFSLVFVPLVVYLSIKRNRRLLVLIILPIASCSFAILIGIIALATYGITPTIRLQSVTELDQNRAEAITRGEFAVFSPYDASGEISFPADAAFAHLKDSSYACKILLSDKQTLEGPWIESLTPTFFHFTRYAKHSEKLEVKRIDSRTISVFNLLGADIASGKLNLNDAIYDLSGLAAGETKTFGALNCANPPIPECGTYSVTLNGSPFFPSPFGSRRTKGSIVAEIHGKLEENIQ